MSGYAIKATETAFIQDFAESFGRPDPRIELHDIRQGWGHMVEGKGLLGGPLQIQQRVFAWGLAGHADSEIALTSGIPLSRIRGFVGIEANKATRAEKRQTKAVFSVMDGSRVLWTSRPLDLASEAESFDLPLTGQTALRLCATSGTSSDFGHINWGEPVVETAAGESVEIGNLQRIPSFDFLPMDFTFGQESMHAFISRCGLERGEKEGATVFTSKDPRTGLVLEFTWKHHADFPVCEWHVAFHNEGNAPTPILRDVKSLSLKAYGDGRAKLLRGRGSFDTTTEWVPGRFKDGFMPVWDDLDEGKQVEFAPKAGRCSDPWMPFFNYKLPSDGGLVFAIGWAGQWQAKASSHRVEAGFGYLNAKLLPGESITLPSIYMVRYDGDDMLRGNNILRRFIREKIAPRYDGEPVVLPACNLTWGGMPEKQHLDRLRNIQDRKLPFDVYWIDAGWYGPAGTVCPDEFDPTWSKNTGNWKFNPTLLPNGLDKISKAAHEASLNLLLWMEPERAIRDTSLPTEHPDWFLAAPAAGDDRLLNLGKKEALDWCVDFVSKTIEREGLDVYREDYNIDPLSFWRANDAPDRQGITEIHAVNGLYRFWAELRRRFPRLLIDNCASGGRRIDIELLRFSVPLWASDMQCIPGFDPDAAQTHVSGLSLWVPFFAFGTQNEQGGDTYNFRSAMAAGIAVHYYSYERLPLTGSYPHSWLKDRLEEFRSVRDCMSGDFYPLVDISPSKKVWSVSEFYRPDLERGALFAFRRDDSDFTTASLRPQGLRAGALYEIHDFDSKRTWTEKGEDIMARGIRIELPEPRSSRLILFNAEAK